jgi:hypothetical protein
MLHSVWAPTTDTCSLASAPATDKYKVTVDRTINLVELTNAVGVPSDAGHAFVFPNGDMQVKVSYGSNISKAIRSSDGGLTWKGVTQQLAPFETRSSSEFGQNSFATSWGEVLEFSGFGDSAHSVGILPAVNGSQNAEMRVSTDNGLTMGSRITQIYLPAALKVSNMAHAGMVELADESLLSYSYGHWAGIDGFIVPWPPSPGATGAPKERTFVMRSTDRGLTFNYLSTVAFDSSNNTHDCVVESDPKGSNPPCAVNEGFDEGFLSAIPYAGGIKLQMMMRSGGSQATAAVNGSTATGVIHGPMYRAFSMDSGLTWSIAQAVSDRGVTPVTAMAGSVHVVGYGRPADWLMFSSDSGVSYDHWCYHDGKASGHQYDGSNYNSLALLPRKDGDADNEFRLMTSYYNGSVLATFVTVTVN